jgi:hypothetical protein
LPYEIKFFTKETFSPAEALWSDIVYFQSPELAVKFPRGPKYIWDLNDYLESTEVTEFEEIKLLVLTMQISFKKSHGVIFSSKKLAKHYKNWFQGRSIVMDDYIDPCTHKATNQNSEHQYLRVGYFGTDYYKKETLDLIKMMTDLKTPCYFSVMGVSNCQKEIEAAGFKYIPYNNDYGSFNQYLASQGFDIGIVWYDKNKEINISKTHLKWSEWSWLGIPTVSSRFVVEEFVIGSFTKFADNEVEFRQQMRGLIKDKQERLELGERAKIYAENHSNLHDRIKIYVEFFEKIKEIK